MPLEKTLHKAGPEKVEVMQEGWQAKSVTECRSFIAFGGILILYTECFIYYKFSIKFN